MNALMTRSRTDHSSARSLAVWYAWTAVLAMAFVCARSRPAEAIILTLAGEPDPAYDGGAMKLWLRADMGVTTGATFTWADQSLHGNDASQTNGALQPTPITTGVGTINGQAVLDFDGGDSLLGAFASPNLNSDSFTGFAVIESDNPTNSSWHVFDGNVNSTTTRFGFASYIAAGSDAYLARFQTGAVSSTSEVFDPSILSAVGTNVSTNTVTQSLDGNVIQSPVFSLVQSISGYRVGSRFDGAASFVDGRIAEVLIYDKPLTSDEYNAVGFYLQERYGIDGSFVFVASQLPTPEPSTGLLLMLGAVVLGARGRRQRRSA